MSDLEPPVHDEFYKSLLSDFLGEAEQLLVALDENLTRLAEWVHSLEDERQPPCAENLLSSLFRSAHSLKGLSNMLGLDEIERLLDLIQHVFDAARKDELTLTSDVVDLLFEAVDRVATLVDALKDPDAPAVAYEDIVERIVSLLRSRAATPPTDDASSALRTLGVIQSQVAEALSGMTAPPPTAAATPTTFPAASRVPRPSGPGAVAPPRPYPITGDLLEGVTDEADMSSRFISIFIDETGLALDQLTASLLALENTESRDELKRLLVIAHRIKGSAACIGLHRVAKLSHFMEDVLQDHVDTGRTLSGEVIDVMLKCVDELRRYVDGLKQGFIPADGFGQRAVELLIARQISSPQPPTSPGAAATLETPGTQPVRDAAPSASASEASLPAAAGAGEAAQLALAESTTGTSPRGISEELRQRVTAAAPIGLPVFAGVVTFQSNLPLAGLKAELLYEKLSGMGDVCYFDPPAAQLETVECLSGICFGLATERSIGQVRRALRTAGVVSSLVEPLLYASSAEAELGVAAEGAAAAGEPGVRVAPPSSPGSPVEPARAESAVSGGRARPVPVEIVGKPAETLRVDINRLDQLMNLAGQLVVSKAHFAEITERLRAGIGNRRSVLSLSTVLDSLARLADRQDEAVRRASVESPSGAVCQQARWIQSQLEPIRREVESFGQMHATVNELEEAVHQLERVAEEIQQSVMDTRMVPIGPLFTRFHRVVRDITRASGKAIRLVIRGEKTELDKRMIDELGDPLIHIIRNSADHGIESAEARRQAGKPDEGTIMLDASHRGNSIVIQISDDGCGLDTGRILAKVIEGGLVAPADADRLTPRQIHDFIWRPGFSTARQVTEVSGRGVGMDIVKSRVEMLGGTVDLESEPGVGTTITIKLPLTLAILPSLMIEVAGDVFAIPLESVAEIVHVGGETVSDVHGKHVAQVRGRVVSIVRLDDVFQWNGRRRRSAPAALKDSTLVIVGERRGEVGLAVDTVIGEEDIVIKSIADNYRNVAGIVGASVLGDGRVSLILDPAAIIAMAAHTSSSAVVSPAQVALGDPHNG